ncbi:hypothetical protein J2X06_000001 [Lysobacter niastensis]|uniref:DUF695 domain-containing protein n=1 Tax=Lysobacter niastensis TaxID=380629 RepID=A0ABU1W5R3_9GAMM|nr:DUF695 domain-containing protein [Lysobacter niastensis]MDR7132817.1 hypothetical protein [Lysobacter niastensis]
MSEDSVAIVVPDPHYTLFDTSRRDLPAAVVVNDSLLAFEHTDIFAWHLEVTLHAVDLADKGMPTPDESRLLFEIGDEIEKALVGYNALFLARSTWNGLRQLFFRVYDPDVADKALQEMLVQKQVRGWEFRMEHDPQWQQAGPFFQLFPSASGHDA